MFQSIQHKLNFNMSVNTENGEISFFWRFSKKTKESSIDDDLFESSLLKLESSKLESTWDSCLIDIQQVIAEKKPEDLKALSHIAIELFKQPCSIHVKTFIRKDIPLEDLSTVLNALKSEIKPHIEANLPKTWIQTLTPRCAMQ